MSPVDSPIIELYERNTRPIRVPRVSYGEFLELFDWHPDQHVTVCGPTGCGKSVLIIDSILPMTEYPVYFATKPRDKTMDDGLTGKDWGFTDNPKEIHPLVHKKWIVGLKGFGDPDDVKERHRALFSSTLRRCFSIPGWSMIIDEGRYVCDPEYLGLRGLVAQFYIQGRSDHKPIVLATQRPRHVPLEAFDQATHLFFFNDSDLQNVIRMAEAAGANRKQFQAIIPSLETTVDKGGEFLYYNRVTREKVISKVEL
jgi:hypothetical protein